MTCARAVPAATALRALLLEAPSLLQSVCNVYMQDYLCLGYPLPPGCEVLPPMPPAYDASWPSAMLCQPSTAGLLRPEASESLFLLYRLTGDETYRAWGWEIFQAIEKHARRPDSGAQPPELLNFFPSLAF